MFMSVYSKMILGKELQTVICTFPESEGIVLICLVNVKVIGIGVSLSLSPPPTIAHTKAHTYAGACVDGEQSRTPLSFSFTFTLHPQVVATETVGTIFLGASPLATALLEQGANVDGAGKLQWVFTDSISLDSSFSFSYPRGILALVPASRYIVEFEDHWVGWAVCHCSFFTIGWVGQFPIFYS